MDSLKSMTTKKHMPQLVLAMLFIVYLVMNYPLPESLATILDTLLGKVTVLVMAMGLFGYNPVLGVLGMLVAYRLIMSASVRTGMAALNEYYPTEDKKWTPFTPTHQFDYTLEEELVKKMTNQKFNVNYVKAPYRPTLNDTHDAELLVNNKNNK
jgi:hypothetical protein